MIACAWRNPATSAERDLRAQVDFFDVDRPHEPIALQGLDLTNAAIVSDAQLLAFLGAVVP